MGIWCLHKEYDNGNDNTSCNKKYMVSISRVVFNSGRNRIDNFGCLFDKILLGISYIKFKSIKPGGEHEDIYTGRKGFT